MPTRTTTVLLDPQGLSRPFLLRLFPPPLPPPAARENFASPVAEIRECRRCDFVFTWQVDSSASSSVLRRPPFERRGFHVVARAYRFPDEAADRILRPFPFSLPLALPLTPFVAHFVFPPSSPHRRDIYGELYDAFWTDNRGGVLIRVCFGRMRITRGNAD